MKQPGFPNPIRSIKPLEFGIHKSWAALQMVLFGVSLISIMTGRAQATPIDKFLIYLWGVPDVTDDEVRAKALADAGFTVVNWDPAKLGVLQRHGLKAMVHGMPEAESLKKLAGDSRIWGFHLGDEPYPEEKFSGIAEQFRILEREDPWHVPFINMLSTTGDFLATYMETVKPSLLSFDYYQWWWGTDRYFEKLEQFRDAARFARVPLAACIEVTANPGVEMGNTEYLADNARKLRQSVYTTLAYGAKGIEWYSAAMAFESKSVNLTPAGRDMALLNQELQRIGPVLVTLQSVDVFQTPPVPAGTRTVPKEYWLTVIGEEGRPGLVQGMFKDGEGRDYALIANRDYRDAQAVIVRLQSKWLGIAPWNKPKSFTYGIEQLDRATSQWRIVTSSSATGFSLVLGAGDGQLFRFVTKITSEPQ